MRGALVLVAAAGCGRTGFASLPCTDAHSQTADASPDATAVTQRATLSLDRVDPGLELDGFPLLVSLDDTHAARDLLDATASNIRFLDSSGNVLPHEIDDVGTAGLSGYPLLAWVRVPAIVGLSTTIDVEIGDALPAPSPASVWDGSYLAVYHLNDGTDATANHHDAMPVNGPVAVAAPGCAIGGCQSFTAAVGSFFTVPDSPTLDLPMPTVTGWLYQKTSTTNFMAIVSRQAAGTNQDFMIATSGDKCYDMITTTTSSTVGLPGPAITIGHWTHIALVYDGSALRLYVDGSTVASSNPTGNVQHNPSDVDIGAASGLQAFVDGMVDEIHVESIARPPQWIAYEDKAMRDLVITYGAVSR